MTYGGECHFCGEPVDPRYAAYPITGWEVTRGQGGANRIVGRERQPGIIAHPFCAEEAAKKGRAGISSGQEQLL